VYRWIFSFLYNKTQIIAFSLTKRQHKKQHKKGTGYFFQKRGQATFLWYLMKQKQHKKGIGCFFCEGHIKRGQAAFLQKVVESSLKAG
jgi:hypothetical protein